jgi:hypothetical protein
VFPALLVGPLLTVPRLPKCRRQVVFALFASPHATVEKCNRFAEISNRLGACRERLKWLGIN